MALFCFSIIIYELEREVQPAEFDYGNSFWYTFATITTLGFGDYIVITTRGRFVTGFIVATGIFLDTLVVVAILENISLGEKGRLVLNFFNNKMLEIEWKTLQLRISFIGGNGKRND